VTARHAAVAAALGAAAHDDGYLSIEMTQGPAGIPWRERLEAALVAVNAAYRPRAAGRAA